MTITSSSAMEQRPCDTTSFWGVGHIEAKFYIEGYVSCQYLLIVRRGHGYTTTLPLEVFTQRNLVADFIPLKLNFI